MLVKRDVIRFGQIVRSLRAFRSSYIIKRRAIGRLGWTLGSILFTTRDRTKRLSARSAIRHWHLAARPRDPPQRAQLPWLPSTCRVIGHRLQRQCRKKAICVDRRRSYGRRRTVKVPTRPDPTADLCSASVGAGVCGVRSTSSTADVVARKHLAAALRRPLQSTRSSLPGMRGSTVGRRRRVDATWRTQSSRLS